jgi:hypothetical protein
MANVLISLTMSNVFLDEINDNDRGATIVSRTTFYNDINSVETICYCHSAWRCIRPSMMIDIMGNTRFIIPGIVLSCYPGYATLESTLICLFNQTCINELRSILNETTFNQIDLNTPALDPSVSSRYNPNTRLEDIIMLTMKEMLFVNLFYHRYYEKCRPSICFYTITKRNNPLYVLTIILSLIGDLSKVLQLIMPHLVTLVTKLIKWCCRRNQRRIQIDPI